MFDIVVIMIQLFVALIHEGKIVLVKKESERHYNFWLLGHINSTEFIADQAIYHACEIFMLFLEER